LPWETDVLPWGTDVLPWEESFAVTLVGHRRYMIWPKMNQ
jgi:hypothetical protein